MSYLDRLKRSANAGAGHLQNHQNPVSMGSVGFEGAPPGPFQTIEGVRAANDPGQKQPLAHASEALPDHPGTRQSAQQSALESALKSAARSCLTCRHLKRPGLSDGHCGGRDDLPPAYGPGHPLRRLPDSGGASCTTWELAT